MNIGELNKVWEIKTLKKKPGEEEARKILERIAKQVQPLMRKRKWRVKLLSEFCPNNASLLGLNVGGGVHVKLRLRRPNRDWDFFPYDQILDTMLHELCHNVHGPHNASFYQLWDELRKECEELVAKGITGTGEGFDLPGRRLGGFSRQPPLSSLHQTALAAAEKRARLGSLLPSGAKRLGGDSTIMTALSPIQAAAMAAERRLLDDIWCGSESCEDFGEGETSADLQNLQNRDQSAGTSSRYSGLDAPALDVISQKRRQASDSSSFFQPDGHQLESNFVDLSKDTAISASMHSADVRSQKRSRGSDDSSFFQSSHSHPESSCENLPMGASTSGSVQNYDATCNADKPVMWECGICTLLNPPLAPICELCDAQKPKDVTENKTWSCKFCTLENSVKLEKCSACGEWRYSCGPPVSTFAPNRGT